MDNPRKDTVNYTITVDLGYCCEGYFFRRFLENDLIALRLGVMQDTVVRHRRLAPDCAGKEQCLAKRLGN